MSDTGVSRSTTIASGSPQQTGRLPYLPGLDGLRAVAVVAVMLYHADHEWLPGGFLGVEVFFVISGYLITLLLVGEFEREGRIDLRQFWSRRARRLLPPLVVMLAGLAVYMTVFRRTPMGRTRGDFAGGMFYVSNWYQIAVGQGYTAGEAFVPLRHLWSLAVEEQFYLIWPLVMAALLVRRRGRDLPRLALCKYPNVKVGYWGDLAPTIPGMSNDGIHLKTSEAKQAYADLIATWTGVSKPG